MWKHLSHSNVVSFLGVTLEPLQLVSEWIPGGELREHVRKNPKANRLNLVSQVTLFRDVASLCLQLLGITEGLAYLHSCNVIHGDLKGVRSVTYPVPSLPLTGTNSRTSWSTNLATPASRILVSPLLLETHTPT